MSHDATNDVVRVAQQIALQPSTQHCLLVVTNSYGLLAVEPRAVPLSLHSTLPAHGITDVPQGWPFYLLVSNFSNHKVRLQKHIIIDNIAAFPSFINTIDTANQNLFPIGTLEIDIYASKL